jgi:6,7-dimethyl-8-ribityllumazine synthase
MGHGIDYATLPKGQGLRIGVVAARWNGFVVEPMFEQALVTLQQCGATPVVVRVPGAFELPVAAKRLAHAVDAVIAMGAVIRGDTPHFDFVAGEAARGLQEVAVATGLPVIFGVLTTNTQEQAEERADPLRANKGREFALSAIETVLALQDHPRT